MAANLDRRAENLAFCFQEILTVGERLRSNRQAVSDANSFRQQIRAALQSADAEARKRGYTAEDIQLAIFAVVAFLDESILNLRSPIFADWPRRPMQEEMFGHHVAGEIFFQNLQKIMGRNESQETADLLEVYQLCLLLGFAGRYSIGGRGELRSIVDAAADKIRRIRQLRGDLSPAWALPNDTIQSVAGDPWIRRLMFGTIGAAVLTILLFGIYKVSLNSGVSTLENIASQGRVRQ
jgi:type VI secretion system protein ImpK